MKKIIGVLLSIILFCSTIQINILNAAEGKINDWPLMEKAIKYEDEKNYDKALYYWEELVKLYSNYTTIYAYENGGHYAKKAGDYYSGVYNSKIFDNKKAAYYYEKAYHSYLKFSELSGSTKNNWAFVQVKKKLDDIKTSIDLYMEKEINSNSTISRTFAKHEPISGMYIGIYGEGNPDLIRNFSVDPDVITGMYGKQHASLLYYNIFGTTPFPSNTAAKMKELGGSIQIQMQPMNGLDEVVDGEYLRSFAKEAKASGIPVFLRFAGEMNGDWVAWGLQPKKYIEKFRLVHDIMEKEAPNVAMVWAPNFFPWDNMAEYYPGDSYVDWVGLSCYTFLNYTMENKETKLKSNPIDLLQYIVKDYGAKKPIMIVEGAISYYAYNEPKIDYTNWAVNNLKRFYSYIPLVYPEIKAMYYFDAPSQGKEKYIISNNNIMKSAYKDIISGNYYLSKMGTSAGFKYEKVINSIGKKKINFVSYVKSYEPTIGKVEYYVDNKLIQTTTKIPYNFTYDFSNNINNSSKITIKAYDMSMKLIESKDYSLNLLIPDIKVLYNNKQIKFSQNPVNKNGRVLVPMRGIFEAFGMDVEYNKATKTVIAKNEDKEIILTIGSNKAYVNGKEEILDVASELINNSTMVPLRFVSQSLGLKVDYEGSSRTVRINN